MAKLKLTYFDFHSGRGEPARLALSMGGIPFEDDRVPPSDWQRRKPNTPFGALPSIVMLASLRTSTPQIRGRLRYATKSWRRWKTSIPNLRQLFSFPKGKRKPNAKRLIEGPLPSISRGCSSGWKRMEAVTSLRTVNGRRSQGLVWIRHLKSGVLDYVPANLPIASRPSWSSTTSGLKTTPASTATTPSMVSPADHLAIATAQIMKGAPLVSGSGW
jgi:glutathione S-transferase